MGDPGLEPGRSRTVSGAPSVGSLLAAGRKACDPAQRVCPRRHGQTPDLVPSANGRSPGKRGRASDQRKPSSVAETGASRDLGNPARRVRSSGSRTAMDRLGRARREGEALVAGSDAPSRPVGPHLGPPERPSQSGDRPVVLGPGHRSPLHPVGRILVESGGIDPAHPRSSGVSRAALRNLFGPD